MADRYTPCMLVTANVGSIFEDPKTMLKIWVQEFLAAVKKQQPKFLALHCQEVGGKQYEESMKYVEDFVRMLMSSAELMPFDRVRVFLDEDYASSEKFTALGNFYFVHESIKSVQIWDFRAMTFLPVLGKEIHSGNIENVTTKEKSKFPPELFPECKWSRKGFLRTRWYLNGSVYDLVNIHLFHDASNFVAIESFPSVYSEYRRRAMSHVLDRFKEDQYDNVPFFVFGDFNFRLNTQGVVSRLTNKTVPHPVKSNKNGEVSKILYTEADNENKVVLTVGKKEFDHHDKHDMFSMNGGKWLREYDVELRPFLDRIFEYEINFPPSYPFSEEVAHGNSYMKTRCPAWCDRILLSKNALPLVYNNPDDLENSQVRYHVIGPDMCMGDHKPVYLMFRMVWNAGTPTINTHDPSSHSPVNGQPPPPPLPHRTSTHSLVEEPVQSVSSPTSSYSTARTGFDRDLTSGSPSPEDPSAKPEGGSGTTTEVPSFVSFSELSNGTPAAELATTGEVPRDCPVATGTSSNDSSAAERTEQWVNHYRPVPSLSSSTAELPANEGSGTAGGVPSNTAPELQTRPTVATKPDETRDEPSREKEAPLAEPDNNGRCCMCCKHWCTLL